MLTEKPNPQTTDIDRLSSLEIVTRINDEDQRVALAVQKALPQIAAAIDGMVTCLQKGGRVIYIGAGTSGRLGLLDAVEIVPTFGTPPELFQALIAGGEAAFSEAQEGAEDRAEAGKADLAGIPLRAEDVVIGIAASGRTPYVLGAVEYARQLGALTVGIACNEPAPLLDAVDLPIAVPVGAEVIGGSTRLKAGTAQKMVLNMLSTASMIQMGKVHGNLMVDVKITNEKLARRARDIVMQLTDLDADAATQLLAQAQNQVKVAVVMHHRQVGYAEARAILAEAGGFLRRVLGG